MWIMVLFDLPVKKKLERKNASKFRHFLISDGYIMLQYSVYARPCKGPFRVEKHINRLKSELPPYGKIRMLKITDKQYGAMEVLLGQKNINETYSMEELFVF